MLAPRGGCGGSATALPRRRIDPPRRSGAARRTPPAALRFSAPHRSPLPGAACREGSVGGVRGEAHRQRGKAAGCARRGESATPRSAGRVARAPACRRASSSDSSPLSERRERSEQSEFGDGAMRPSIAGQPRAAGPEPSEPRRVQPAVLPVSCNNPRAKKTVDVRNAPRGPRRGGAALLPLNARRYEPSAFGQLIVCIRSGRACVNRYRRRSSVVSTWRRSAPTIARKVTRHEDPNPIRWRPCRHPDGTGRAGRRRPGVQPPRGAVHHHRSQGRCDRLLHVPQLRAGPQRLRDADRQLPAAAGCLRRTELLLDGPERALRDPRRQRRRREGRPELPVPLPEQARRRHRRGAADRRQVGRDPAHPGRPGDGAELAVAEPDPDLHRRRQAR